MQGRPRPSRVSRALNYQRLLRNQVGTLVVTCTQPGVSVAIDGERRIACPGTATVRVRPGRHVVVGDSETLATGFEALDTRIDRQNTYWISSAIGGGILTVVGVSLVVLNRPTDDRPPVAVGMTGTHDRFEVTLRATF